jgi:hypothetical protein
MIFKFYSAIFTDKKYALCSIFIFANKFSNLLIYKYGISISISMYDIVKRMQNNKHIIYFSNINKLETGSI